PSASSPSTSRSPATSRRRSGCGWSRSRRKYSLRRDEVQVLRSALLLRHDRIPRPVKPERLPLRAVGRLLAVVAPADLEHQRRGFGLGLALLPPHDLHGDLGEVLRRGRRLAVMRDLLHPPDDDVARFRLARRGVELAPRRAGELRAGLGGGRRRREREHRAETEQKSHGHAHILARLSSSARRSAWSPARRARTSSTTAAGAVRGARAGKGGAGSYSSTSGTLCATASPASSAASRRPKSIPAVTPPPVTRLRSTTTRSAMGIAPTSGRRSRLNQWVV